jgi:ABC-type nitrate/sulfonate/bicarbonate transport system substrate-binding protein
MQQEARIKMTRRLAELGILVPFILVWLLVLPAACASTPATVNAPPAASPAPGAPAAASPPELVPVRYGYAATSLVFITMKVAVEQGFYRQYGLAMEPVLTAPNVTAPAQLSGELEYTASYPGSIRSASQGSPFRIVSTSVDAPLFMLVGRPEIGTVAELRGKAVGVTTRGGVLDKVTRDLLGREGVDASSDVTILATGGQVTLLLEALVSGRVQGAVLSPPWFVRARDQGMRMLVRAPEVLREPQAGLVVTEERLLRQRDQVRQVVQAEIEAGRFIHQNRERTVAISRDWLEISQQEAEESYDFTLPAIVRDGHINVEGLERFVATEKEEGTVPPDFQIEGILDTTLVPEALRALQQR